MSLPKSFHRAEAGIEGLALELPTRYDEHTIRRGMRLVGGRTPPITLNGGGALRRSDHASPFAIVGGAALLAGGFCLGWEAFRRSHQRSEGTKEQLRQASV